MEEQRDCLLSGVWEIVAGTLSVCPERALPGAVARGSFPEAVKGVSLPPQSRLLDLAQYILFWVLEISLCLALETRWTTPCFTAGLTGQERLSAV